MLVLVLGWTQCLPQGVGAPPATHGWLPKKTGRPGLWRGGIGGYNLHSVPPTVAHQPRAGCIRLVLSLTFICCFKVFMDSTSCCMVRSFSLDSVSSVCKMKRNCCTNPDYSYNPPIPTTLDSSSILSRDTISLDNPDSEDLTQQDNPVWYLLSLDDSMGDESCV